MKVEFSIYYMGFSKWLNSFSEQDVARINLSIYRKIKSVKIDLICEPKKGMHIDVSLFFKEFELSDEEEEVLSYYCFEIKTITICPTHLKIELVEPKKNK